MTAASTSGNKQGRYVHPWVASAAPAPLGEMNDNSARGINSVAAGSNCHALHDHAMVIGDGLESSASYQIKFGTAERQVTLSPSPEDYETIRQALILAMSGLRG